MVPSFIKKSKIPHKPGVYIFKSSSGKILYVGKAIDLYHRVSSYFNSLSQGAKGVLVENIRDIETIIVESELEALILEANLIKKYLPPFNVRLTDDKDYLYIVVTKGNFPKIETARKKDLPDGRQVSSNVKKYWGPFPSSKTVKNTLKLLRRVFPWCSNPPEGSKRHSRPGFLDNGVTLEPTSSRGHEVIAKTRQRPCFYYHLKLCPGACTGKIEAKDYQKIINRFSKFMDGKKEELSKVLTSEMMQAAKELKYEEASSIKKTLEGMQYLTQTNRTTLYLENPNFLEDERKLALEALQKDLGLKKIPERIEGYDISNIQGKESTGSLVVLTNGEIDKSQYRKFKIHISGKPNDVGMHKEMMGRRLAHKEWPKPDLIIIDGGRGQVRGAKEELTAAELDIPILGLAKRMEWLYPPEGEIVKLSKRSPSLKLLQKLRDEAHRFAITYHRKLHRKSFMSVS